MEVKPIQRFVTGPGVDFYYNFQSMISLLGSIPLPPWSYGLHTQRNTCKIEVGSNYDNSSSVNMFLWTWILKSLYSYSHNNSMIYQ